MITLNAVDKYLALDIFEDHYSEQQETFYQPMWDDSSELDLGDFTP